MLCNGPVLLFCYWSCMLTRITLNTVLPEFWHVNNWTWFQLGRCLVLDIYNQTSRVVFTRTFSFEPYLVPDWSCTTMYIPDNGIMVQTEVHKTVWDPHTYSVWPCISACCHGNNYMSFEAIGYSWSNLLYETMLTGTKLISLTFS